MKRITASGTGWALRQRYPDDDVHARAEPGGVRVTVSRDGARAHFCLGDQPGVLSAWLGIDPGGGPHGDGGQAAGARLSA